MLNTHVDSNGHTLLPVQIKPCGPRSRRFDEIIPIDDPFRLDRRYPNPVTSKPVLLPPCLFNAGFIQKLYLEIIYFTHIFFIFRKAIRE